MERLLEYFFGSIGVAESYNKLLSSQQKFEWERKIKMHHGKAGFLVSLIGILTENPKLVVVGAGLMVHDWKDKDEWFRLAPKY